MYFRGLGNWETSDLFFTDGLEEHEKRGPGIYSASGWGGKGEGGGKIGIIKIIKEKAFTSHPPLPPPC